MNKNKEENKGKWIGKRKEIKTCTKNKEKSYDKSEKETFKMKKKDKEKIKMADTVITVAWTHSKIDSNAGFATTKEDLTKTEETGNLDNNL